MIEVDTVAELHVGRAAPTLWGLVAKPSREERRRSRGQVIMLSMLNSERSVVQTFYIYSTSLALIS